MHPLLILSCVLLATGGVIAAAGRVVRRGSSPVCRRCGFHLSGLADAPSCPECGRSLSRPRAVASGERRGWPTPVAAGLVGLAAVSLGYVVIDSPAMDRRKPLWVLDAERRVFGASRDARAYAEVKRRMDAVPADPADQRAIGQFAVTRAVAPGSDLQWHGLAVRAVQSQWAGTEQASALARAVLPEVLRPNPSNQSVLMAAVDAYFPHASIGWAEIKPLIDRVESMSRAAADAEQGTQARFAWLRSPERRMLSAWAESAWPTLTIDQRDSLTGSDSASYMLEVPRRVVAGESLPYFVRTRRQPLIAPTNVSMWSTQQWGEIRIDGKRLSRPTATVPASYSQNGGIHNEMNGGMGTTTMIPVPPNQVGPAEVVVEIRPAFHVGGDSSMLREEATDWPWISLAARTEVLPVGTELPEPATASPEVIAAILDCLSLRFEWVEDSTASNESRLELDAMFTAPTLAIDHYLIVIQNGIEFHASQRVSFAADVTGRGYGMWIHAESVRHRHLSSERQPETQLDPNRPFTIMLVPDAFTRWEEGVVSQRIPLGTYAIARQEELSPDLADEFSGEFPSRALALQLPDGLDHPDG